MTKFNYIPVCGNPAYMRLRDPIYRRSSKTRMKMRCVYDSELRIILGLQRGGKSL